MSDDEILGKFRMVELLAVGWSDDMTARFPNANHAMCRTMMTPDGRMGPCHGWHCNRCGAATGAQGGHDCPDRPPRTVGGEQ